MVSIFYICKQKATIFYSSAYQKTKLYKFYYPYEIRPSAYIVMTEQYKYTRRNQKKIRI